MSEDDDPPIVVMGVSGAGKSSVALLLAKSLGAVNLDADDLHSAHATAKMASGIPLTDQDREPWLDRVAWSIRETVMTGRRPVVACSALRRSYRDRLRHGTRASLLFVHLVGDEQTLRSRLEVRDGHFMPSTLLQSQLETLEPLERDEDGFAVSIADTLEAIVQSTLDSLRAQQ